MCPSSKTSAWLETAGSAKDPWCAGEAAVQFVFAHTAAEGDKGGCDQGPCNSRSNSMLLVRGDIHLACVYMNVSQVCVSEGCKEVGTSLNPLLQRNTCDCPCLIYHLPDSEDRPAQSLWVAAEIQPQLASYI